jgi:NAD(P)-dependent dehydrogenase (short-subunit alcohol dehydrogenase family)
MKDFRGKVAVITGAASGIGRALAERCAREGMKVVLADVEPGALAEVVANLPAGGATALAVRTDVSQAGDVEALARKTLEAFGAVHLLCNNAGVATSGTVWESGLTDWEWVLGVNLWGVIHGVRTFIPVMLAQDTECHVVNTASLSGLISFPRASVYAVSKHGVVTLSEALHHELAERGGKVKVSVLCPGLVQTRIVDGARNRPDRLAATAPLAPVEAAGWETLRRQMQTATPPQQIADAVFQAIRAERFYILPHPEGKAWIRTRMEDILQERTPTLPGSSAEPGTAADGGGR